MGSGGWLGMICLVLGMWYEGLEGAKLKDSDRGQLWWARLLMAYCIVGKLDVKTDISMTK